MARTVSAFMERLPERREPGPRKPRGGATYRAARRNAARGRRRAALRSLALRAAR